MSAIQACITKLRQRQPNPTSFNLNKVRGVRPRDVSRAKRDVSPAPPDHVRQGSDSSSRKNGTRHTDELLIESENTAKPTPRKLTASPSSLPGMGSLSPPSDGGSASLPLGLGPRNSPTSGSAFNFISQDTQAISTAKRGVLRVLKTSLFSRQDRSACVCTECACRIVKLPCCRWVTMVFELQANDRILSYYDQVTRNKKALLPSTSHNAHNHTTTHPLTHFCRDRRNQSHAVSPDAPMSRLLGLVACALIITESKV